MATKSFPNLSEAAKFTALDVIHRAYRGEPQKAQSQHVAFVEMLLHNLMLLISSIRLEAVASARHDYTFNEIVCKSWFCAS